MWEPLLRALPRDDVHPRNTALLVIDMERDFVDEGAVQETPGGRAIVPVINTLTGWARRHAIPVVFTQEMHRADRSDYGIELEYDPVHCLEGTSGCQLVRACGPGICASPTSAAMTASSGRTSTSCCAPGESRT
jgi:hypothetical protein